MLKLIDNYFFDFDGVIKDSVDCKTEAFESMYSKYGNQIAEKVKNLLPWHRILETYLEKKEKKCNDPIC